MVNFFKRENIQMKNYIIATAPSTDKANHEIGHTIGVEDDVTLASVKLVDTTPAVMDEDDPTVVITPEMHHYNVLDSDSNVKFEIDSELELNTVEELV